MLYLLAVVISAARLGRGPSILVSILSVLAFDFFLVPPVLTFAVADTEYLLTFAGLLAVSLVISQLTVRVREQAQAEHEREAETASLYALSRDLAVAGGLDDAIRAVIANVTQMFGREVVILLPEMDNGPHLTPHGGEPPFAREQHELGAANWAFEHGQQAGYGTETLPAAAARYVPLRTARGVVGVMGVKPANETLVLSPDQRRLLEAFAGLAALAIERVHLAEAARNAQLLEATEKLQTALLNSISHDLRTPLVAVTGALSTLAEDGAAVDEPARRELVDTAYGEARRLNRLVGNLLDMTRIEAGALKLSRQPSDVQDVIGSALEQVGDRLGGREVKIEVPPDLPLVPMDAALMLHVLVNLIDNSLKYSPAGSSIEFSAQLSGARIRIDVADRGVGVPADQLERVFDKFYRVQHPGSIGGTGLGLSICKGIVEAHGGTIRAARRPGGGTTFSIELPQSAAESVPPGGQA
jgi:two-component system sensor histidine kinase KdpD